MNKGVSIVIVTYNGAKRLVPTLTHLAKQEQVDFNMELVLVNNNSTDDTVSIAERTWQEHGAPYPLCIVLETKSGTMFARKKGIEASKYRYMLYCDDDNWLDANYVSTAYHIISENEAIAAVGGCGNMQYDPGFEPPLWITNYENNYGTTAQGLEDGDTTNGKGCLYTAGTILDKLWLDKIYAMGFQSALQGRDGKTLVAGEDTELTYALKLIGGKLYYSSKMQFQHYMPKARINWDYLKKLWASFGYSNYVISPYDFYFSKKENTPELQQFFKTLKIIIHLSLSNYKHGFGEGDHQVLLLARKRGELKAIIKAQNKRKIVRQSITRLKAALV